MSCSVKPVPQLPTQWTSFPRYVPSTSAPKLPARLPCPFVQPQMTNSSRPCVLSFSQSRLRLPSR